ncbi:hypothetical protein J3Q64DRAFT_1731901 [Phycomyces blakesleeanus]|uniref:Secreted protein n=1 Tax=Phycomyces blakesleeanus TaxID=4837 RepID=A0ABR3B3M4_PHYBL
MMLVVVVVVVAVVVAVVGGGFDCLTLEGSFQNGEKIMTWTYLMVVEVVVVEKMLLIGRMGAGRLDNRMAIRLTK